MADKESITAERLRELMHYDPGTGQFTRLVALPGHPAGQQLGALLQNGYLAIRINYVLYLSHRLAWLYMTGEWPKGLLDHRNRNKADNRWSNLRPATRGQNAYNSTIRCDNTSGFKGVSSHTGGRWRASMQIDGIQRHIGTFDTAEEAAEAYRTAVIPSHGEFARFK
jgi:hypothetical protein